MASKMAMMMVKLRSPKEVKENPMTHPALKAT